MPKLFGKRSKPPALAAGRVFEVTSSEIGGSTTLLSNSSSDAPEDSHADSEEALVLALKEQVGDLDVAQSYTNKLRDRTGGPPSKELGHCVVRAAEAGALEALVAAMAAHAYCRCCSSSPSLSSGARRSLSRRRSTCSTCVRCSTRGRASMCLSSRSSLP